MKNNVQLITYADRFASSNLSELKSLIDTQFNNLFSGLHILPFYTFYDGEDAGYDPVDHYKVDPRLGDWSDIKNISLEYEVMVDLIVNHISSDSDPFQDYLLKGDDSQYKNLFLTEDDVFPGGADDADLDKIYRPRPGQPFTKYDVNGKGCQKFWTTFSSKQIDINVYDPKGREYVFGLLEKFAENGLQSVRLDAVGYAVKKAGETCFMMPKTYRYISELAQRAHELNIEVLVEIHSHYSEQIKIAKIVDYVYDFSLPPLVLYAMFSGNANPLKKWLSISPQNCITVLDTHDGIGIMDVAPGNNGAGLLDEHQIHFLVECIHRSCNDQSRKSTGHAANNLDIYQINSTFYSALGDDDNLYLLSRLIQFVSPGIPQVYYVGLLAGENDMALLSKTSVGRDINRHYYNHNEIEDQLNKPVVQNLIGLINFRNNHPAFKGKFSLIESVDETLKVVWSGQGCKLFIEVFLDIKEFSIVSIINDEIEQFRSWECIQSFSGKHDADIPNKEVMNDEQLNN